MGTRPCGPFLVPGRQQVWPVRLGEQGGPHSHAVAGRWQVGTYRAAVMHPGGRQVAHADKANPVGPPAAARGWEGGEPQLRSRGEVQTHP